MKYLLIILSTFILINGTAEAKTIRGLRGVMVAVGAEGRQGPIGPMGLRGVTGTDGSTGPRGFSGSTGPTGPSLPIHEPIVIETTAIIPIGKEGEAIANCPPERRAISGGFSTIPLFPDASLATEHRKGWRIHINNTTSNPLEI